MGPEHEAEVEESDHHRAQWEEEGEGGDSEDGVRHEDGFHVGLLGETAGARGARRDAVCGVGVGGS